MGICYSGGFAETSFMMQLAEFFFLTAGCVVHYIGFPLTVLTLGLFPLYVFAYYVLRHNHHFANNINLVKCYLDFDSACRYLRVDRERT